MLCKNTTTGPPPANDQTQSSAQEEDSTHAPPKAAVPATRQIDVPVREVISDHLPEKIWFSRGHVVVQIQNIRFLLILDRRTHNLVTPATIFGHIHVFQISTATRLSL